MSRGKPKHRRQKQEARRETPAPPTSPRRRPTALLAGVAIVTVGGLIVWAAFRRETGGAGVTQVPDQVSGAIKMPDLAEVSPGLLELISSHVEAMRTHPSDPEAHGQLGHVLYVERALASARQCYENARRLDPGNYTWWYYLARMDEYEGRSEAAMANFREVIARNPDYAPAQLRFGELLVEAGAYAEAETALRKYAAVEPDEPAVWIARGRLARARDQLPQARQHLAEAVRLSPSHSRAHYLLGVTLRDLGESELARKHLGFSQLPNTVLDPPDPLMTQVGDAGVSYRSLIDRAKQADGEGRIADALTICEPLLTRNAQDPFVHYYYGTLLLKVSRQGGRAAERHFRRAIALRPDYTAAMSILSAALIRMGRITEGDDWHRKAVTIQPDDPDLYFNHGLTLLAAGRGDQAVESFEEAVRLDPKSPHRLARLGYALYRVGKNTEALKRLHEAIRIDPNHGEPYFLSACAYARLERRDEALEALRSSVRLHYATRERCDRASALTGLRSDPRYASLFAGAGG